MRMRHVLIFAAAILPLGCIVEAPTASNNAPQGGPQPQQQQMAQPRQGAQPMQVKVGANLADKVEIVGAIVDPGMITPGIPARVNVFFKVLQQIPEDYMIFVHIEDAEGRMERLNVDHKTVNGQYPTNAWKVGETVKDEFQIYLPPGAQARAINVLLGLWNPANDQRMKLKNVDQVRNDGKDRILIAQVPVGQ